MNKRKKILAACGSYLGPCKYTWNPIVFFESTWKTDNAGTSNDDQITLPLEATGTYDFTVYWGDGSNDTITAWDQAEVTHTYASAGTYTVKIKGDIDGWRFNNGGDKLKLLTIENWGDLLLGNSNGYFYGCENLNVAATDVLDVSNMTTFLLFFQDCISLTTLDVSKWNVSNVTTFNSAFSRCDFATLDVSSWDVSSGTIFDYMFQDCANLITLDVSSWDVSSGTSFQVMFEGCTSLITLDVSSWDTSSVTNFNRTFKNCTSLTTLAANNWDITSVTTMQLMFSGVTLTTVCYDAILIGWEAQAVQNDVSFHGGDSKYGGSAVAARAALIADHNWTITDGGAAQNQFVSTWKTDNVGTSNDDQITLPLDASGTYDFTVYWGDGNNDTITTYNQAEVTHTYASAGTYYVTIIDTINVWRFNNGGDKLKLLTIESWGDLLLGNSGGYFYGCANLNVNATDVLDVSNVTNFYYAFNGCSSLTTLDVSSWNVSSVTTFAYAFRDCSSLVTLDVSSWDVSSVTTFERTFYSCTSLITLDVSSWDMSSVTILSQTFRGCLALTTLAANNWDITSVTNMGFMFIDVTLTTVCYDAILIGWEAQAVKNSINFHAGNSKYTGGGAAEAARAALIADHNWTITDGGTV